MHVALMEIFFFCDRYSKEPVAKIQQNTR